MKLNILLICSIALLFVQSTRAGESLPSVVLLGDSIRMNYQAEVIAQLKGKAVVWAPKDNCRHTAYTLENLDKWLAGRKPAVIHINIGLHDMFLSSKTGKTRHTLQRYTANLRQIFTRLRKHTDAKIIFATTTPVIEERQAKSKGYRRVVRRNTDVNRFNQAALAVAKEMEIAVNDLNQVSSKAKAQAILKEDGIHLSPTGIKVLGQHVAKQITQALK